jgi:acetolactate synthase-1/2/3 large subunit
MTNDNQHPTLTGAEILWASLAGEGTTTVFGYPGGAILPIYDALRKFPTIHHILVRHEQGAAHMADGYARASGRVGVCMATSGPGATNLVTGLATAMLDSIPIVAITGQVSSKVLGTDAFQEVDITGITLPITKHNFLITRAEDIAPTIREAFQIARSGRPGPVLVDITKDAQQASTVFDFDMSKPPAYRPHPMLKAESSSIREAIALIRAAKKPVILALGMRFDDRVTGNLASYSPASKKIHIEIDPSEINKNVRADVALIGDLKEVLQLLLPLLTTNNQQLTTSSPWLREINASKGTAAVRDIINLPDNGHLYAAHVIHDIWREAQAAGREQQTIIVTDVGQHQMWEAQYFKHEAPRSLVTSGGLGTMGFALPAAIGAKVACPEKDVWVIAGDGGFQMTAAELSTIVQEKLAINIAVINNGFLGMVRQWQETFYDKNYSASPILSPDFVKLADAHDIAGAHITQRKDVTPTVTRARTSGKPFLINFAVEKEDGVYPMIAPGAALHEMVRRPDVRPHDPLLETAEDQ